MLLLPLLLLLLTLLRMRRIGQNSQLRRTAASRGSAEVDTRVSLVPQRCLTRRDTQRGGITTAVTGRPSVTSGSSAANTIAALTATATNTKPCVGVGIELPA